MARTFEKMTVAQFAALVEAFPWKRKINAVHMHHTWRPNRQQYRGHVTIEAMWRYHTQVNQWSDIAQHVTIAPDGTIWSGRNWNAPPASASGHNGNRAAGPFMFEIIGDFDEGQDVLDGVQRKAVLDVIVAVQRRFGLPATSLQFHNQMSSKSCPGSALNYDQFVQEVAAQHNAADGGAQAAVPDGDDGRLQAAVGGALPEPDPADAEPVEAGDADRFYEAEFYGESGVRAVGLRPNDKLTQRDLARLRPYVINLNQGEFTESGIFETDAGSVDAIFQTHIPAALQKARAAGIPLRIMFYAHGGLVSESNALKMAWDQIHWWEENNRQSSRLGAKKFSVYPIYFVWETGFLETIFQLLSRIRIGGQRAVRDVFDFTSDPVIEAASRALQGPTIWGGMKSSADMASRDTGGAYHAAGELAKLCAGTQPGEIELYAVGHSAGAIFHAHFLPMAAGRIEEAVKGTPAPPHRFEEVCFLAPAIRVDTFKDLLLKKKQIGAGKPVEKLSVFTMERDTERADHCGHIYRKSLLYLIYHALERNPKTDLLGLQETLQRDPELRRLFGLDGRPGEGEIIWSPSPTLSGRRASHSTSHGGFDNDPTTMESVLRRVCNLDDNDPIHPFPQEQRRGLLDWESQVDWPEGLEFLAGMNGLPNAGRSANLPSTRAATGRRRALCVGINAYPRDALAGCVADAESWSATLRGLGFDAPRMLLDGQATRENILGGLRELIRQSEPGDVVVFQFAGHGTQAPDVDGDEADGDSPGLDEALCPVDFRTGRLLIDDDLAEVLGQTPSGVCVTCFIDCCHSGTVTRLAVGGPAGGRDRGERTRFIQLSPDEQAAHVKFRRSQGGTRSARKRTRDEMHEVVFSACTSQEVAFESNGSGHFTARTTRILQASDRRTHRELQQAIREAFGPAPRQNPVLDCAPGAEDLPLWTACARQQTGAVSFGNSTAGGGASNGDSASSDRAALVRALRAAADALSLK